MDLKLPFIEWKNVSAIVTRGYSKRLTPSACVSISGGLLICVIRGYYCWRVQILLIWIHFIIQFEQRFNVKQWNSVTFDFYSAQNNTKHIENFLVVVNLEPRLQWRLAS